MGLLKYSFKKNKKNEAIEKAIENNYKSIRTLLDQVEISMKAVKVVEDQFGVNNEASKYSTIFAFLNLSIVDVLILFNQFIKSNNDIEKNFICRSTAHYIYEFFQNCSKALGKEMKEYLDLLNAEELSNELIEIRKTFNSFKARHNDKLKKIRHNVSAHKDRNMEDQLNLYNSIDVAEFDALFIEFFLVYVTIYNFQKRIVNSLKEAQKI